MLGSRFHGRGGGVGMMHKQSRVSWWPHTTQGDSLSSLELHPQMAARSENVNGCNELATDHKLHSIGDDGEGVMSWRDQVVCEALGLNKKERLGRRRGYHVLRSMDKVGKA